MRILLAVLTSVLFFTACEFNQDPLANAPEKVKTNNPPITKPEGPKACPVETLFVDAPSYINARVNDEVKVQVAGRTMIDGLELELKVDNMKDFPGAKFDPEKGVFTWVPNKEAIIGVPSAVFVLNVSVVTKASPVCQVAMSASRAVPILVVNEYDAPVVKSVTSQGPFIAGEKYATLTFAMEDVDAIDKNDVTLNFRNCDDNFSNSIAHLIKVKSIVQDENVGKNFSGTLQLDLTKFEYFPSGRYCFEMFALSKFGMMSEVYKHEFDIEAKLQKARMTLDVFPDMNQGTMAVYPFSIFEPAGNGVLTLSSVGDLEKQLPGSSIVCKSASGNKAQLNCVATFDATNAMIRNYSLALTVDNEMPRSAQKLSSTIYINVRVLKAVTP
ncbi:hypothetical protein AZI86_18055 [Bdellovibrio bacteriovorus]|uniref:Uncharacterized protein n=1 Tax=Bdellovibrio bacteriovorus TaxID=959 RepID=A0A150WEQ8_BDEBC|nr:hypothetical protein [Bdellovibrio bacteriovorus]KYG61608.1 hypothetical protein AZI86_18055 [Bdellovibrio bacteriovorus]